MPLTLNGIGTMYYGRRDTRLHAGVCEHCRKKVELVDYETTLFFVVLYLPLIPLGRKQLLNACPSCYRHRVLSARKWQRIKRETLEESTAELARQMDSPEAGLKHLYALSGFGEFAEARDLAEAMENQYSADSSTQFALGAWYEYCKQKTDADRCFGAAYKLAPENPAMIRAQGLTLLEQGKLDEGRELLMKLAPPHPNFDPTVFSTLGLAFQDRGRNAEALAAFEIAASDPRLKKDKAFQRLVRKSERAVGKQGASMLPPVPFWKRPAFIVLSAIASLLTGMFILAGFSLSYQTVQIINSGNSLLLIQMSNGEFVSVQGGTYEQVKFAAGMNRIRVQQPHWGAGERSFEINTTLWERLRKSTICILDPLETSLVTREQVWYHEKPDDSKDDIEFHYGRLYQQFPKVDLLFKDFPREVELKDGKPASLTRLGFRALKVGMLKSANLQESELLERAEHLLQEESFPLDDSLAYVTLCEEASQRDRAIRFFEASLDDRVFLSNTHLLYQELIKNDLEARNALITRYDNQLQSGWKTADLLYFRSRMEIDYDRAMPFVTSALRLVSSHRDSLRQQAYLEYSRGGYRAAAQLMSEHRDAFADWQNRNELLFAAGEPYIADVKINPELGSFDNFAMVLRYFHESGLGFSVPPKTYSQIRLLSDLRTWASQSGEALPEGGLENLAKQTLDPNDFWRLSVYAAYLGEDLEKLDRLLAEPAAGEENGYWSFIRELEQGSQIHLAKIVADWGEEVAAEEELLMAIQFKLDGGDEQAHSWLESALGKLEQDGPLGRHWAGLLRRCQTRETDSDEVRDISDSPRAKSIYGTAILAFSEEPTADLLEVVKLFNYHPGPPRRYLNSVLNKLSTGK